MTRNRSGALIILAIILLSIPLVRSFGFRSVADASRNRAIPENPQVQTPLLAETPAEKAGGILPGFPIDINTATEEDLALLPGIGPKTAARILEKRKELGGFTSVDQLTEVKWVGKVKLEKIRNLVTIKGPVGRPARKVLPKQ